MNMLTLPPSCTKPGSRGRISLVPRHSEGGGAPTTAILVHVARPYVIEVACLRNTVSNTAILARFGYRLVSVPAPTNPSALYGKRYTRWMVSLGTRLGTDGMQPSQICYRVLYPRLTSTLERQKRHTTITDLGTMALQDMAAVVHFISMHYQHTYLQHTYLEELYRECNECIPGTLFPFREQG